MTPLRPPALLPLAALALALALALAAAPARAERADREKPINFAGDTGEFNYETKRGDLSGNVVLTQGTLTIRADRIEFRQNPDNSVSAKAIGNPVSFRQKKDGAEEYYEGYAQRVEYDGARELVELFDRALLKTGPDEIRSNYVSYNSATGQFRAEGRPDAPDAKGGPGARVRGVFQPKEAGPDAKGSAAGKAPAAGKATADGKTAKDPARTPLPLRRSAEPKPPATQ